MDLQSARELANKFWFREEAEDAIESLRGIESSDWASEMEVSALTACLESRVRILPTVEAMERAEEGLLASSQSKKSSTMKRIRQMKSEARKLAKTGQYDEACDKLKSCIDLLEDLKTEIKDEPDSTKSYLISQACKLLCSIAATIFAAGIANYVGTRGGVRAAGRMIADRMKGITPERGENCRIWSVEDDTDYGRYMGSDTTAATAATVGILMAGAKYGIQTAAAILKAKKNSDTKNLNENNQLLKLILTDIDRVISGLKKQIQTWQKSK